MMSAHDSPPSLVPLFARLSSRDAAAINDILTHCQKRLKALTRRMLNRSARLRDSFDTSEVYGQASIRFLRALRRLPLSTPADFLRLAAWHIRRTLIDLTRRRKFVGVAVGLNINYAADDTDDSPVRLAMWQEFHEVVANLPDDDRQLFDLLFYQELSLGDASHLLGVPKPTLKLRWQQARARLVARFRNLPPV
jgi:RNA polymerase sigma factor (sigma-70 family)